MLIKVYYYLMSAIESILSDPSGESPSNNKTSNRYSRRDFLGLSGAMITSLVLGACTPVQPPISRPLNETPTTEESKSTDNLLESILGKRYSTEEPSIEQLDYLEQHAVDPVTLLESKFDKGITTVGITEIHNDIALIEYVSELLNDLKNRETINFLALEMIDSSIVYSAIKEYFLSGGYTTGIDMALGTRTEEYLDVLKTATKLPNGYFGLVDPSGLSSTDVYEEYMQNSFGFYYSNIRDPKGVFFAGDFHVRNSGPIGAVLNEKYNSAQVLSEVYSDHTIYQAYKKLDFKIPIAIDVQNSPFAHLTPSEVITGSYQTEINSVILIPE